MAAYKLYLYIYVSKYFCCNEYMHVHMNMIYHNMTLIYVHSMYLSCLRTFNIQTNILFLNLKFSKINCYVSIYLSTRELTIFPFKYSPLETYIYSILLYMHFSTYNFIQVPLQKCTMLLQLKI